MGDFVLGHPGQVDGLAEECGAVIAAADFAFALWMPPVTGGIALLVCLYLAFGLGNGSTFQLVPHRWKGKTGLLSGIVGAAGGIGGFYLPVVMGIAKENTGSYQMGFATFGAIASCAFLCLLALRAPWMRWAAPTALVSDVQSLPGGPAPSSKA